MKTLYHGTTVSGIDELEPRRRFTPGALGTAGPPAVYATDDPAYAAAQAFPWNSAEGFDLRYDDGVAVLTVPQEHALRLEQPIYVYEVPAASFELLPDVAPRGRNYRSLRPARPVGVQAFPTVRVGIERYGGNVRIAASQPTVPDSPSAPHYVIRPVRSLDELGLVCDVIGAQITPPMPRQDRRFQELWPRFDADRSLMWLAEDRGEIVGGALAFRPSGGAVTVRAIGLAPRARRHGLGRRLMAAVELEAIKLGARGISLGAKPDSTGFYRRLGYAGRGAMMHKGLPFPGRLVEARLRKLAAAAGAER